MGCYLYPIERLREFARVDLDREHLALRRDHPTAEFCSVKVVPQSIDWDYNSWSLNPFGCHELPNKNEMNEKSQEIDLIYRKFAGEWNEWMGFSMSRTLYSRIEGTNKNNLRNTRNEFEAQKEYCLELIKVNETVINHFKRAIIGYTCFSCCKSQEIRDYNAKLKEKIGACQQNVKALTGLVTAIDSLISKQTGVDFISDFKTQLKGQFHIDANERLERAALDWQARETITTSELVSIVQVETGLSLTEATDFINSMIQKWRINNDWGSASQKDPSNPQTISLITDFHTLHQRTDEIKARIMDGGEITENDMSTFNQIMDVSRRIIVDGIAPDLDLWWSVEENRYYHDRLENNKQIPFENKTRLLTRQNQYGYQAYFYLTIAFHEIYSIFELSQQPALQTAWKREFFEHGTVQSGWRAAYHETYKQFIESLGGPATFVGRGLFTDTRFLVGVQPLRTIEQKFTTGSLPT